MPVCGRVAVEETVVFGLGGVMKTFEQWWGEASHRLKYEKDHPVYLAGKEAYEAALAPQASKGAVPEGWKLIPIEPTEEMDAAARAECHRMSGVIDPVIHIWDVMLAAAPLPAQAQPVAYADPQAFKNFEKSRNGLMSGDTVYLREWMWANPSSGLVPMYLGAQPPANAAPRESKQTGHSDLVHAPSYELGRAAGIEEAAKVVLGKHSMAYGWGDNPDAAVTWANCVHDCVVAIRALAAKPAEG